MNDYLNNIPKHWVVTELDNLIIKVINGDWGKELSSDKEIVKVKIIRGNEFSGRDISFASERYITSESFNKRRLGIDDIVLEISGGSTNKPVGRVMIIDEKMINSSPLPLICSNFYKKISLSNYVISKFVYYYLTNFWFSGNIQQIQTQTTGIKNLDFNKYVLIPIPLSPLNEQKRIVEKLDLLLPKVKSAKERLERIPQLLKKFRQSVLAAACSGKLTEEWRENNYNSQTSNEQKQENIQSDTELPFEIDELPVGWEISKLEELCDLKTGGTPSRKNKNYFDGKIPWLKSGELNDGYIYFTEENISEEGLLNSNAKILPKDTLLIALYGATIGKLGITKIELSTNQAICAFLNISKKINKSFLFYFLLWKREDFQKKAYGAAQPNISVGLLKSTLIFLPPLPEQEEIVRRVEKLFAIADKVEEQYKKAMERVEKLEQSILAKAFRGELAEPDPNDEPAEILLEKILNEKKNTYNIKFKKKIKKDSRIKK